VHKHKHNMKNENKNTKTRNHNAYICASSWRPWLLKAKRLRLLKVAIKRSRSSKVQKLRSLKIVIKALGKPECA
jgi:hypothetical protein